MRLWRRADDAPRTCATATFGYGFASFAPACMQCLQAPILRHDLRRASHGQPLERVPIRRRVGQDGEVLKGLHRPHLLPHCRPRHLRADAEGLE
eukprot:5452179-Pleurochrysis_carterae.AAC.2